MNGRLFVRRICGGKYNGTVVIRGLSTRPGCKTDSSLYISLTSAGEVEFLPLYPMTSTLPPCLAMLIAWYCIRGLRPTSPRTSTWTEILGSSADAEDTAFGGECLTYRLGKQRRIAVKIVEAIVAKVKRISSMATWLQELSLTEYVLIWSSADHLQIFDAMSEDW
jgi:hypothetical protein